MPETIIPTGSLALTDPKETPNLKFALACLASVLMVSGLLAYSYRAAMPPSVDYLLVLAVASIVILVGMSGLYYYAYNFYHDDFYLFISLGWLANAIYICFEGFFPGARGETRYSLWVDLFMIVSLVPFYFAGTLSLRKTINYKALIAPGATAVFWAMINYLAPLDSDLKLAVITVVVAAFAFYSLYTSGSSVQRRLNPRVQGPAAKRLVFTFHAYAFLQFIYLVTLIPHVRLPKTYVDKLLEPQAWILSLAFGVALLLKVLNSVSALSIIRHDFTDLRVRLIRSQEELARRSRFEKLGLVAASILHEILNPLGVIETRISLMKDTYQSSKDESIKEILANLDSIEEQRQKIFGATKIIPYIRGEREFYESKMKKVNVGDLLRRSIKNFRDEINTSNVVFRIGNKEEAFFTKAVPQMLEEAFINVLKNAVEAIRDARRKEGIISIEMSIDSKTDEIMKVEIRDNGSGIQPENVKKVTMPLFSTRRGEKPNSGLGLFITDEILNIHNGKLDIASTVNVGTTVSFYLPLLDFHKKRQSKSETDLTSGETIWQQQQQRSQ